MLSKGLVQGRVGVSRETHVTRTRTQLKLSRYSPAVRPPPHGGHTRRVGPAEGTLTFKATKINTRYSLVSGSPGLTYVDWALTAH